MKSNNLIVIVNGTFYYEDYFGKHSTLNKQILFIIEREVNKLINNNIIKSRYRIGLLISEDILEMMKELNFDGKIIDTYEIVEILKINKTILLVNKEDNWVQ